MAARTTVALTVLSQLGVAALYLLCRNFVGYTFSSDPEVVATFAAVIPIAALFQVPPTPSILLPHACVSVRVCVRAWRACMHADTAWALTIAVTHDTAANIDGSSSYPTARQRAQI